MFYTFYRKFGNKILFRYIDDEGVHRSKTVDFYKPSLFLDAGDNEPDAYSIYGEPLRKKTFDCIKDANEFAKDHQHISGFNIQGNSRFDNQFLIELFEGGIPEYDSSLIDIGYIDIETDYDDFPDPIECKYPIQQVDIASTRDNIHYSFGLKPYNHKHRDEEDPLINKMEVVHEHFDTEEELLKAMILHFENRGWYDLTSGLNSEEFDIPYIINRVSKVIGFAWAKRLSPYKTVFDKEKKNRFGNVVTVYDIVGMPHLDYMKVYEKHTHDPIENFKLETIAQKELGRGKVGDDDDRSLKQLWEEDPDHYIFYNIVDVQLLVEIDKVTGLMDLIFALSYITLSNYEDAMATNKMWENLIARHLYNQSIAPFYEPNAESFREYEGAYVHPPVPGKHRWVVGFDLASLYPHIIQQCNIGVESIVEPNNWTPDIQRMREPDMVDSLLSKSVDTTPVKDEDLSLTANGQVYTKDQPSFLSQIMKMLYEERKVYKKRMKDCKEQGDKDGATKNNNMQMGMKILLNSGYGAVANKHFLYYRVENAEAITLTGQLVNRWCGQHLNELLQGMFGDGNYWVAGDTDSLYFTLAPVGDAMINKGYTVQETVDKLDEMCEVLIKKLHGFCADLAQYLNSYKQAMTWEREVISETAIWVAKKKYSMKVWDDEGDRFEDDPKYKIMGLESVKSSTPQWSKGYLVECYKIALEGDEDKLHDRVAEIEREFYDMDINRIAIPSGVNNIMKYYDPDTIYAKGTPKHVKGVLIHNWLIDQKGIKRIPKILKDGSKIKYVSLKKPNPINQEVVAFDGELPPEFGLDRFVNRREIFVKAFLDPLQIYLDAIGWNYEPVNTLM